MSTRQYIGARYTPKFSGTYDATQAYEALEVVDNGSGTTYIARKPVPPNTPLTNTEYWLVYGSSSGAILNLQTRMGNAENDIDHVEESVNIINGSILRMGGEIDTMKNGSIPGSLQYQINTNKTDIESLEEGAVFSIWHNKKVCVYGDSLSSINTNYWNYMHEEDDTIAITNRSVGGSIIQNGLSLLQSADDLDSFDIIVLAYGTNSWSASPIKTMINCYVDCFHEITRKAPNVQIITIAPFYQFNPSFGVGGLNSFGLSIYDYAEAIEYISGMYGVLCFNLYKIACVNQWNYSTLLENSEGYYYHEKEYLARRIARLLLTNTNTNSSLNPVAQFTVGTGTLVFYKTPQLTVMSQFGAMPVASLLAFSLPELAPNAFNANCMVLGDNGTLGTLIYKTDGTFTAVWNGTTPTTITGINMNIFNGTLRPH